MSVLGERLLAVHDALQTARMAHAFGGAIALAYCTEEPRGTQDLDLNVFVSPDRAGEVFAALPDAVKSLPGDLERAEREGQVRLRWEETPVDLFFDSLDFHREVARGVRWVPFEGRTIPVVGCLALAVFKSFLGRTKDWADIEAMVESGKVNVAGVRVALEGLVGPDGRAVERLSALEA